MGDAVHSGHESRDYIIYIYTIIIFMFVWGFLDIDRYGPKRDYFYSFYLNE